jgi:hypothetical protein
MSFELPDGVSNEIELFMPSGLPSNFTFTVCNVQTAEYFSYPDRNHVLDAFWGLRSFFSRLLQTYLDCEVYQNRVWSFQCFHQSVDLTRFFNKILKFTLFVLDLDGLQLQNLYLRIILKLRFCDSQLGQFIPNFQTLISVLKTSTFPVVARTEFESFNFSTEPNILNIQFG